jgi:twitching motility protein PilT
MDEQNININNPVNNAVNPAPVVTPPPLPVDNISKIYTAKPTDLPNIEDVKPQPVNVVRDVKKEDEIVLPSAPSPLNEKGKLGGEAFKPIRSSLEDIVPDIGIPKAVAGKAKENNLASPEGIIGKEDKKEDLVSENMLKQQTEDVEKKEDIAGGGLNSMEKLLKQAVERNASDLHINVGYPVTIRIDGELQSLGEQIISAKDAESLIYSILSDERKELLEVDKELDFAYSFEGGDNERFRINAYYSKGNLSAAFRLIPQYIKTIEELQLPQLYHQFAQLKQGLILVTGPTGHGKSTTIAAILEDVNKTRFCHIVTIEDPIEYVFQGKKALIDQREMNSDTHSWTVALKSALRQDPDVILVGEMRDYETIAAAITLAETGHLVFATLHTNSAAQTIDRIIDVFPENQQAQVKAQLANILEAVVAQRLIPLDSGGRRAVSEIMLGVPSIKNLIREGKTHQIDNVIRTSTDIGMVSLESSLVKLVREGVISIEKAQEYAVYPEEIVRMMKK